MGLSLNNVVPWGRSFEEYAAMFSLTEADLNLRLLGCGDGPASFNAEVFKRGGDIVSVDPLYAFSGGQIRQRIAETYPTVIGQVRDNQNDFVWEMIPSVEALGTIRMAAMDTFLADYELGQRQGRYVAGELPSLPFADRQFDLALCSHFLFLYSAHFSAEFHLLAILEMLRVAKEIRVFPLLTLDGQRSPYLDEVIDKLAERGFDAEIAPSQYEFQRGGNQMLRVKPAAPRICNDSTTRN